MSHRSVVLGTLAPLMLLLAPPLRAQSLTSSSVSGSVTTAVGQPLPGALVTLTSLGVGGSHEATTNASGTFTFALVAPGAYEVRAEALGYRPVVARTLTLAGGERSNVSLSLAAAPPPVLTIDTVTLATASSSPWRAGRTRFGTGELEGLPYRFEDLTSVAALASSMDETLGSEGLPGSMTLLVADGVPVYRAPHPLARAEQLSDALFPRSALSGVMAYDNATDVEWSGSAGGYLALATRSGTREGGLELEGAWSGAPLWSSSELDISAPSLTSFQAGARATIPVSPNGSQIVASADGFQQETPLGPRVSETIEASLAGLDPDLIEKLSTPRVERLDRFSTLARFDAQRGTSGRVFLRGGVAYSKREFDGPGPITLARDVPLPEESVDFSVGGGLVSESRPGLVFELRGGVSGSSRTFDVATEGMPSAFLSGSGSSLGVTPAGSGESSRVDVVLLPIARYDMGQGTLKLGLSGRATSHKMTHGEPGEFFYSDGPTLVAGQGFAYAMDAPEASFSTRELGAFAQYDFQPSPGLSATVGGRLDYETIPSGDATLNGAWLQASGLRNDEVPSGLRQLGARGSLTWDPSRDGSTTLFSTVTLHHGDLDSSVLSQLFSQDEGATSTYFAGSGLDWPMASLPAGATALPTLTLLGPDTRAPRSARASIGIVRRLVGSWNVHVGASYRRTDFLMRRRNLNLPALPQALDAYGRDVYGTLQQDGSLITATGSDARRFAAFSDVWALDPDGWSEHRAATAGLEYSGASLRLYVSYTRSETTDNWIGASQGLVDAELSPRLPASGDDWAEGTSDYDVPDRISASASTSLSLVTLSALYRYRSGLPFTPRYRAGVDANGDGSYRNDVAYVDAALVDPLLGDWSCLSDQTDGFAVRNSCRGPGAHSLDARLQLNLGRLMGRDASLVLDGFNLIESEDGIIDEALLLVDPSASITSSGGTVTIPVLANPNFGRLLYSTSRGRMMRIGFRIG